MLMEGMIVAEVLMSSSAVVLASPKPRPDLHLATKPPEAQVLLRTRV
jgi:hypothetical protein